MGFRVGATNLPVHHVDAAFEAPAPVPAAASPVIAPEVSYAYLPYASNYGYSVPAAALPQLLLLLLHLPLSLLLRPLLTQKTPSIMPKMTSASTTTDTATPTLSSRR